VQNLGQSNTPQQIWVVRAGRGGSYADVFLSRSIVALPVVYEADAREATTEAVAAAGHPAAKAPVVAALLRRFATDLREGDTIISPVSRQQRHLVGTIVGGYRFVAVEEDPGLRHVHAVDWRGEFSTAWIRPGLRSVLGSPMPLYRPAAQEELWAVIRDLGEFGFIDSRGAGP
jgi:predicted Mrr-cat superfamily restriction endonuclease